MTQVPVPRFDLLKLAILSLRPRSSHAVVRSFASSGHHHTLRSKLASNDLTGIAELERCVAQG